MDARAVYLPLVSALVCVPACGAPAQHPVLPRGIAIVSSTSASSAGSSAPPAHQDERGPSSSHADALGRLAEAPWGVRLDRRRTLSLPLPDAHAWTHVRFWGVTTLAGWRYGDDHHAVAAAFSFMSTPVDVERCTERFVSWARARAKAFDIDVGDQRAETFAWPPGGEGHGRLFVFDARRRSIFWTKRYAAAYAVYPAWQNACLVIGVAVPEEGAEGVARDVRDRLVREALTGLSTRPGAGSLALEADTGVD